MKPAAEIIYYTIKLSKQEYEDAMKGGLPSGNPSFELGWILSKAMPSYTVNKDTELV